MADETTSNSTETPVYATDTWIFRIAVGTLGGIGIAAMVGSLVISGIGGNLPEVVGTLGAMAIGALAGIMRPLGGK